MATTVSLEGNILKLDNGTKIEYLNASWCSMSFTPTSVKINDESKSGNGYDYEIAFTDFIGAAAQTEAAIATFLSDKIG